MPGLALTWSFGTRPSSPAAGAAAGRAFGGDLGVHRLEDAVERAAERRHRADDDDGDERGEQAVLDGGGAGFVLATAS